MSNDNQSSSYWWKKSKNYQDLFAYIKYLENSHPNVEAENMRNMRLYGNVDVGSFNSLKAEPTSSIQNRVTFNVVQSMIDTAVSKIVKNKPRPYFLTDGGDWSQKRKAQKLTQFIDGAFYHTNFYTKLGTGFKHSCIFGTGALKIFRKGDDIATENVFINEIIVDRTDAIYGSPRQLHQKKYVNKDVLAAMFPGKKGSIDLAISSISELGQDTFNNSDMVLVIESWKLPSITGAKDGKHMIAINNDCLFEEKWEEDFFPFIFPKWNDRPLGFFGQGIAEQLTGLQLEINKILRTIQISMHLVSVPKIFIEASSKIVMSHLNNKIGGIVKYAGQPPIEGKLGTIPPDLFNHLDRLYQRAYAIIGISQLSAQAQKPQGLNSGKALRVYNDLETERFMSVGRMYEDCTLSAARIMISIAKKIAADTGNYSVKAPGSEFLSKIDWTDVEMDETDYIMQCFPIAALSNEPAARLAEVQELMQAGLLDKTSGMKLLDYPDLRQYYNMQNAAADIVDKQIEMMVDKQEYSGPEPYFNLTYALSTMQNAYLKYMADGAPEEVLDLFRRYMEETNELIKMATAPQIDPVAAQEALQTGAAAPPPTAELLPSAPTAAV